MSINNAKSYQSQHFYFSVRYKNTIGYSSPFTLRSNYTNIWCWISITKDIINLSKLDIPQHVIFFPVLNKIHSFWSWICGFKTEKHLLHEQNKQTNKKKLRVVTLPAMIYYQLDEMKVTIVKKVIWQGFPKESVALLYITSLNCHQDIMTFNQHQVINYSVSFFPSVITITTSNQLPSSVFLTNSYD